jgi:hypothetical protein
VGGLTVFKTKEFPVSAQKIVAEKICPQRLKGLNAILDEYDDALNHFQTGKLSLYRQGEKTVAGLVWLLSRNYQVFISGTENPFYSAFHGALREYALQAESEKTYFALDIMFSPIAKDKDIDEALQKYGDCRFSSHSDISRDKVWNMPPAKREYFLKSLPLTPWMQVDISDPTSWNIISGIDTFPIIVDDDPTGCPHILGETQQFYVDKGRYTTYQFLERLLSEEGHKYTAFDPVSHHNGIPFAPSPRIAHVNFKYFMNSIMDVREACREIHNT